VSTVIPLKPRHVMGTRRACQRRQVWLFRPDLGTNLGWLPRRHSPSLPWAAGVRHHSRSEQLPPVRCCCLRAFSSPSPVVSGHPGPCIPMRLVLSDAAVFGTCSRATLAQRSDIPSGVPPFPGRPAADNALAGILLLFQGVFTDFAVANDLDAPTPALQARAGDARGRRAFPARDMEVGAAAHGRVSATNQNRSLGTCSI